MFWQEVFTYFRTLQREDEHEYKKQCVDNQARNQSERQIIEHRHIHQAENAVDDVYVRIIKKCQ